MERGITYVVWGNYNQQELNKSIKTVEEFGYNYHVAEVEDKGIGLAHKTQMFDLSPFDTTLFLDTDTELRSNVDYGFQQAENHGICVAIAPATSAHLAGKTVGMRLHPDAVQYNTGVIFFNKEWRFHHQDHESIIPSVFWKWHLLCKDYPKSSTNDQPAFSAALEWNGVNPFVLPNTWNYRAKMRYESRIIHGHLRILHAR